MKAAKQPRAGRPRSKDPASKLVTIKMTPAQHLQFLLMGGSRWVKRLVDEALGQGGKKYFQACPHCGNSCNNPPSTKSGQKAPE